MSRFALSCAALYLLSGGLLSGVALANPSTPVHPSKHPHQPQPSHLQEKCMKAFPNDHAAFKRCLESKDTKGRK